MNKEIVSINDPRISIDIRVYEDNADFIDDMTRFYDENHWSFPSFEDFGEYYEENGYTKDELSEIEKIKLKDDIWAQERGYENHKDYVSHCLGFKSSVDNEHPLIDYDPEK